MYTNRPIWGPNVYKTADLGPNVYKLADLGPNVNKLADVGTECKHTCRCPGRGQRSVIIFTTRGNYLSIVPGKASGNTVLRTRKRIFVGSGVATTSRDSIAPTGSPASHSTTHATHLPNNNDDDATDKQAGARAN